MRWLVLCFAMIAMPVLAQDKAQTLADIKIELGTLMAEFNSLKAELISSGGAGGLSAGGDALQRLDTIEAALMRLTSQTEAVELKVSRVVSDGTRRIGDMEFRLCEVTEGCDISTLGETSVLGGDTGTVAGTSMMDPAADPNVGDTAGTGGAELAIGEQKDFDRAKEALAAGDFRTAADRFAGFAQSYPGGPLSQEAQYLRGEALSQLGETADAARAYLESFSGKPEGPFAADSLLKLGQSLGILGQVPEACVTLAEVGTRFPGSIQQTNAQISMQALACQ